MLIALVKRTVAALIRLLFHRRTAVMPEKCERIGIVMCHWLGDTFWASQTLPPLRQRFPGAAFHVFLRNDYAALFHGKVEPENIHLAPEVVSDRKREGFSFRSLIRRTKKYRKSPFDLIIDLTGNRYSALFSRLLRPRYLVGFEGDELNGLYDQTAPPPIYREQHLSLQPLLVCDALLGTHCAALPPSPPQSVADYQELCSRHGLSADSPLFILCPCAGWPEKEWGDRHYSMLAEALSCESCQVVLVGSANEAERLDSVAGAHRNVAVWHGTLDELLTLLRHCACFIGNDSGLGHLAASYNTCRVVVIFTEATSPERLVPVGEKVAAYRATRQNPRFDEILHEVKSFTTRKLTRHEKL